MLLLHPMLLQCRIINVQPIYESKENLVGMTYKFEGRQNLSLLNLIIINIWLCLSIFMEFYDHFLHLMPF